MIYDSSNVPTDPAVLQELVIHQSQTIGELNAKLDKAITELQRLNRLFEKFFNKSSEKLLKDKDERKKQDDPPADDTATCRTGRRRSRRRAHLSRMRNAVQVHRRRTLGDAAGNIGADAGHDLRLVPGQSSEVRPACGNTARRTCWARRSAMC